MNFDETGHEFEEEEESDHSGKEKILPSINLSTDESLNKPTIAFLQDTIKREYGYAKIGLFIGVVPLIVGAILIVLGITEKTKLTADLIGAEINLTDAPVGLAFALVGCVIIVITRPRIKFRRAAKEVSEIDDK